MVFTHLQVKSAYSLLESPMSIQELVQGSKAKGYTAVALTDTNVMYGALEFYQEAINHQMKPIIGLSLDVEGVENTSNSYPLILLAKNYQGYLNLIQLSTERMLKNQPVSTEYIKQYSDHILAISPGNEEGEIEFYLKNNRPELARSVYKAYQMMGTDFYLGLSLGIDDGALNESLIQLDSPKVIVSDVRYLDTDDGFSTYVLNHIKENHVIDNLSQELSDHSLKSLSEMKSSIKNYPKPYQDAFDNTSRVVDEIDIQIEFKPTKLPKYPTPSQETSEGYLKQLAYKGLAKKVANYNEAYENRLRKELSVINSMGYADYFLIVWDVMDYAHQNNIETGFGRGSAAASLVAYSLDITDVDPLQYDLLFERFLNQERFTMPDIDLDFPDNKRDEILRYVYQKYGTNHVAQIATFGTFAAKASIRDVGRTFGLDSKALKKWSQAIPTNANQKVDLKKAYNISKDLQDLVHSSQQNQKIFETALKIEGLPRHVSTHAAGVVLSQNNLLETVPLQEGGGEISLTQYAMNDLEKVGMLKIDFLALKNLTILADCKRFANQENPKKAQDSIPLNDDASLEVFRRALTDGVFQFESDGIKRVLKRMQPNSLEDIIAINALYRPGPMDQISHFIDRKKGKEKISYPHPDLKNILEVTYGILVYQEQVMKVATQMAGYSLQEADQLRRTMSKKIQSEMDEGRKKFVKGANLKGYQTKVAHQVYDYIQEFANYGFNKAHASAYSLVAYHLAYFKAHFPGAFYTAVLRAYSNNIKKTHFFIQEARDRNVRLKGPDINNSYYSFVTEGRAIRFGFSQVKGLRKDFIQAIVKERQVNGDYKNLENFLWRLDNQLLKEEALKNLIFSGAFDLFNSNRNSLLNQLDKYLQTIVLANGNLDLFKDMIPRVEEVKDFSLEERLQQEVKVTGYYFSNHPVENYLESYKDYSIKEVANLNEQEVANILVYIQEIKTIRTKKGESMSFVNGSDHTQPITLTLFPTVHRRLIREIQEKKVYIIQGKVDQTKPEVKFIVSSIKPAQKASTKADKTLYLRFTNLDQQTSLLKKVQEILLNHSGTTPIVIYNEKQNKLLGLKSKYSVTPSETLFKQLHTCLNQQDVILK